MTKRCRVGVVGCGFFARNHLHSWKALGEDGVDLVAVCDLAADLAQLTARQFSVPGVHTDMARMLETEQLDLVDIVTQVASHKALVTWALRAGVATIVQKPFGRTLGECADMVALSEETGQLLAVHENFRFQRPNMLIEDILAEGRIGTPTWARIAFRTAYDVYAGQPYLREEQRFILTDVGVHVLDLARVFLGEVSHLTAELQRRNPEVKGEDTATMMLRHSSGAVSLVECTYASLQTPDPFPATLIEIEGTRGALRLDADLTLTVSTDGAATSRSADAPVLDWAARPWHVVQDSVLNTCRHILEAWRHGTQPSVSGADNLKTYALCDAAYTAAAEGRAVQPAY